MAGWIKLHRQIQAHWLWADANKLKWWLDILLEANHEDKKVVIKGTLMTCKRGQCVRSEQSWAIRWGVDRSAVRRFFSLLQSDSMATIESNSKTTILTVCKYDSYQSERPAKTTSKEPSDITSEATTDEHKQEGKEEKKVKKDISSLPASESFDAFWNAYAKKEDKVKCQQAWLKMTSEERVKAISVAPGYVILKPDSQFRKNPLTWINGKCWNDEIERTTQKVKQPYV